MRVCVRAYVRSFVRVSVYLSVCLSVSDTYGISRENDSFANQFKKSTHENKACKALILSV